jgi:archaeosine-15-forming tRNA-guanine transglycosylase
MADIIKHRGSKWDLKFTWSEPSGAGTTATGGWFVVTSTDSTAAIVRATTGVALASTAGATMTITDASARIMRVQVEPSATDDLAPGRYYWAAQILDAAGHVEEDGGFFTIAADRVIPVS